MNQVQATAILSFFFFLPCAFGQAPDASTPAPAAPTPSAATPAAPPIGQVSPPGKKVTLDANDPAAKGEDKYVLGVLPNYRTAEITDDYHPISSKYKLTIAFKDSFAYQLVATGAIYAAIYQGENSHPQFGQGTLGYIRRFSTSYADQVIGNMMTEGVMPIVFREDPRYFRKSHGSAGSRVMYAVSRIFVTKTDNGNPTFNFAEVVGNGIASGIGLSYYQDDRDFASYAQNWATQLGTDAVSQILKEFWPDMKRRFHKHANTPAVN